MTFLICDVKPSNYVCFCCLVTVAHLHPVCPFKVVVLWFCSETRLRTDTFKSWSWVRLAWIQLWTCVYKYVHSPAVPHIITLTWLNLRRYETFTLPFLFNDVTPVDTSISFIFGGRKIRPQFSCSRKSTAFNDTTLTWLTFRRYKTFTLTSLNYVNFALY